MNSFVRWQRMGKKTSLYFSLRSTYLTTLETDVMGGVRRYLMALFQAADVDIPTASRP